jgi:hypothetical protein
MFIGTESQFKLKVTADNLSSDDLKGWLAEFQALDNVTLKVRAKKRETKGYSTQHYYRCHHCPFQMAVKIDAQNNCGYRDTTNFRPC